MTCNVKRVLVNTLFLEVKMNGNRIIVHTLIKCNDGYLLTKRSKLESTYPEYWDIPGDLLIMVNYQDRL